jgi:hypothetical protein
MNQTAICNLALLRLGNSQPIASIDDPSAPARACKAVWDSCIQTMLRERPWPFAVRQVQLAVVGEGLVSDWLYSYRYPSGYINVHRLIEVQDDGDTAVIYTTQETSLKESQPFELGSDASGRLIHTDCSNAYAFGTVNITDTNLFDPLFTSALAWFIASEICMTVTKSRELINMTRSMYYETVSTAFAASANEPKPREDRDADMIAARE